MTKIIEHLCLIFHAQKQESLDYHSTKLRQNQMRSQAFPLLANDPTYHQVKIVYFGLR